MKQLILFLRRSMLPLLPLLPLLMANPATAETAQGKALPLITVHKSPYCGCCEGWVDYLRRNGFEVVTDDTVDMERVKRQFQVPEKVASCHTAVVDGYVVEGHVPADAILRLLKERPAVIGISAPGMPADSPGMGSDEPHGYDVVTFTERGDVGLFASY